MSSFNTYKQPIASNSNFLRIDMKAFQMTDEELYHFCQDNQELRIERSAQKELFIMSPIGFLSGYYNSKISYQLEHWNNQKGLGLTADSSTGYLLPDGSMRAPDASWISKQSWKAIPAEQKKLFLPICPEFVIELQSETDDLDALKLKMEETWIKNGAKLAWLISPTTRKVFVYRADGTQSEIDGFEQKVSGEGLLEGFELDLSFIDELEV